MLLLPFAGDTGEYPVNQRSGDETPAGHGRAAVQSGATPIPRR
jgi:hypothetical protein